MEFESGMKRDSNNNKPRYDLIPSQMLYRWSMLMTKGALQYGEDNWRKANSKKELNRFKESAFRHFMQWFNNEDNEDHAVAVYFNIGCYETLKEDIKND